VTGVLVDYAIVGGWDLSAAEQRLWDAFPDRALADLGKGSGMETLAMPRSGARTGRCVGK
jgi:hypothetical protein